MSKWQELELTEHCATGAFEIVGVGCLVNHFTTARDGSQSESMVFVPGVRVKDGTLVKETRELPQLGGSASTYRALDDEVDW